MLILIIQIPNYERQCNMGERCVRHECMIEKIKEEQSHKPVTNYHHSTDLQNFNHNVLS